MFEAMFYTYIKNLISKKNTYFCDEIEKKDRNEVSPENECES